MNLVLCLPLSFLSILCSVSYIFNNCKSICSASKKLSWSQFSSGKIPSGNIRLWEPKSPYQQRPETWWWGRRDAAYIYIDPTCWSSFMIKLVFQQFFSWSKKSQCEISSKGIQPKFHMSSILVKVLHWSISRLAFFLRDVSLSTDSDASCPRYLFAIHHLAIALHGRIRFTISLLRGPILQWSFDSLYLFLATLFSSWMYPVHDISSSRYIIWQYPFMDAFDPWYLFSKAQFFDGHLVCDISSSWYIFSWYIFLRGCIQSVMHSICSISSRRTSSMVYLARSVFFLSKAVFVDASDPRYPLFPSKFPFAVYLSRSSIFRTTINEAQTL